MVYTHCCKDQFRVANSWSIQACWETPVNRAVKWSHIQNVGYRGAFAEIRLDTEEEAPIAAKAKEASCPTFN